METIDKIKDAVLEVTNKDAITTAAGIILGTATSNVLANEADKFAVSGLPFNLTAGFIGTFTVGGVTIADLYPIGGSVHSSAALQNIPEIYREPTTDGTIKITSSGMKYAKFIMTVPEVTGDNGLLEAKKNGRFAWRSISRVGAAVGLAGLSRTRVAYDVDVIDMETALETAAATSIGLVALDAIGTYIPSLRLLTNVNENQIPEAHIKTALPEVTGAAIRASSIPNVSSVARQPVRAPIARREEIFKLM